MKEFKNINEQIDLLKSRNLTIINETTAKENLMLYGYYEIVNGYKDALLEEKEQYKEGETFEHLFSLYVLDTNFKNVILNSTLEFETIFKTALAYTIAEKYGVLENEYLQRHNYRGRDYFRKNGSVVYHLDVLLEKFNSIINDNTQPFKHYREKHNHIPPWILFKGATFGNMYYFYREQKTEIKNKVISIILGVPTETVNKSNDLKQLFSDGLSLIYRFRNRTAHSGRIYNYKSEKSKIRFNNIFHNYLGISAKSYRLGYCINDLYTFTRLYNFFKSDNLSINLNVRISFYLKNHLLKYPDDKEYLLNELGVPQHLLDSDIDNIFSVQ